MDHLSLLFAADRVITYVRVEKPKLDIVGLILGLPLLGFLLNGALSLWQPRAKAAVSIIGAGVLLGAFASALVAFQQLAPVWQAESVPVLAPPVEVFSAPVVGPPPVPPVVP